MTRPLAYDKALEIILDAVVPTTAEACPVRASQGRVLATDLAVPQDMPDLPRSAVDGFAFAGPTSGDLRVVEEVRAGRLPKRRLGPGEAAAIMTGAVVPQGADRVAMIEDCRLEKNRLHPPKGARPHDFINAAGSEATAGEVFAAGGTRIGPSVYPALFCAGLPEVMVHRRPRLGLLISGDEVRQIEDGPAPGQVFDTNRYVLEAVCQGLGVEVVHITTVADDLEATRRCLDELTTSCDLVITSGGVSKGRYDHLGEILRGPGHELLVEGTAIKPGRPLHLARSQGGTLVMGMPGYPSALLSNAFLYLVPALKKMAGRRDFLTRWFPVTLADAQRGRPGKVYLNRVRLDHRDGRWTAVDPGSQLSSHFLVFARCDGLVRMPSSVPDHAGQDAFNLPAGTVVPALHFGWELA